MQAIRSIPPKIWSSIENWGKVTNSLTNFQLTIAWNLAHAKSGAKVSDTERNIGVKIIDLVRELAPEILYEIDSLSLEDIAKNNPNSEEVSMELIKKVVLWDRKHKRLKDHEFIFMNDLAQGTKAITPKTSQLALWNITKARKYGFSE